MQGTVITGVVHTGKKDDTLCPQGQAVVVIVAKMISGLKFVWLYLNGFPEWTSEYHQN